jgi:hypothetical protein
MTFATVEFQLDFINLSTPLLFLLFCFFSPGLVIASQAFRCLNHVCDKAIRLDCESNPLCYVQQVENVIFPESIAGSRNQDTWPQGPLNPL